MSKRLFVRLMGVFGLMGAVAPASANEGPAPQVHRVETTYGELAYWDEGTAEDVVMLVHGLPTSKTLYRDVAPRLAGSFRVITLDLPNFGASEKLDMRLDHRQRAQAVDELRQALNIDSFILVAHDLGSSVAMDYMDLYGQHVEKLVLMSSPVYPDFEEPVVVRLTRRPVLGRLLIRLFPKVLYRTAMKVGMVNDENIDRSLVKEFAGDYRGPKGKRALYDNLWWGTPEVAFADYPTIMAKIDVPTLLVHGLDDPFIPLEHAYRLDQDIANSKLVLIEGAAHFIPLDTPDEVSEALLSFFGVSHGGEKGP